MALVAAEIVHNDDVSWLERGYEELFDVSSEADPVDRSVEHTGRIDPIMPQSRQECERLPMAVRGLRVQALSPWAPAMSANHVGLGPGLVDKDETGGINFCLMPFPACPSARDVGPVLLGWKQRFF
jgi:hypothetical protein